MKPQKTKIINFRFFLILCLAIICLIAFSLYVCLSVTSKLVMLGFIVLLFAVFLGLFLLIKRKVFMITSIILLICVIPLSNLILRQDKLDKNLVFDKQEVLISGRICENPTYSAKGNLKILIDDINFVSANHNRKISGKFYLYVSSKNLDTYNYTLGKYVECVGKVNIYPILPEDLTSVSSHIIGYSFCNYSALSLSGEEKLSLSERLRLGVYNKLLSWNVEYADVGYAMMFGDSSYIDPATVKMFRGVGIAHLLAVSGFHISVLMTILLFIFKKLKVPKVVTMVIMTILLGFYCYLCDFSVSVVRASLMGLIFLYAGIRGKPYDRLSVLSFVACIILLVNPFKLYNISFVLSFSSVLAITLLILPISRLLRRVFYKKFADAVSLVLSVQVALFSIQLFYFGTYPAFSLFSNLICVPLESVALSLLFVMLPISMALPFMSFTVKLFGKITGVVVKISSLFYKTGLVINFSEISFVSIILIFGLIFVLSDFLFVKRKWKAIDSVALILMIAVTQLILLI